jgi:creatinine amidohydrolase
MYSRTLILSLNVVLVMLSLPGVAWSADPPARTAKPEVWLCAGDGTFDLLRSGAEWSFVKKNLSGIKLYVDQIDNARPGQLANLVRVVKENGYQVAVELGCCLDFGPMDDTNGEWSARMELAKIDKLYAAGGKVDFLDLDGPIRRLMHPEGRRDGQRFESMEKAAVEVVDAVRAFHKAHPEIRFWHLTNFPNWGYKGDVSYHARGPARQDYGEYDDVHRLVFEKLKAAGIPLSGVTIDNPFDYLTGEHSSVKLKSPKSVDWLKRVRAYEDRCRAEGLDVNLIVNSERGGQQSDELFHRETLRMVDTYLKAGGHPTRWIVQTWYPYPKQIVPETAPHSMTALVKAVIQRLRSELTADARSGSVDPIRPDSRTQGKPIVLHPQQGTMTVSARVSNFDNQTFSLGIPETIGCRESMLLNFPEAKIEWTKPGPDGTVSCSWGPGGRVFYIVKLMPAFDYVDVEMTIRNHTEFLWHDVFAFNCLNPIEAPAFKDWKLQRTYMSSKGKPLCMAQTTRTKGQMPTVGFYLPQRIRPGEESIFVRTFGATSPDRTDGSWIVTLSEPAGAYMAATAVQTAFLFDNLDRCCLHSAPSFGDIGPGQSSTTVSRLYLAKGTLDDFLKRQAADRPGLVARQSWARPLAEASGSEASSTRRPSTRQLEGGNRTKPHGRMEEMRPDELEKVLAEAPVAFVPLGTFEHHGWHLPVCFDGIKAHALCERVAERTGGAVLPTFFYGTGGGHVGYKWTLILPEKQITPILEATLDHLAAQGFKVVVILTGHYPKEQVDMAHRLAQEAQTRHSKVRYIGLTEPEVTTAQPGDPASGDHAAKYETSIAMALNPAWVKMDALAAGRDPEKVTLPATPRKNASTHDPKHPLYAIHGQDPRTTASKELGEKLVNEIVSRLSAKVARALAGGPDGAAAHGGRKP